MEMKPTQGLKFVITARLFHGIILLLVLSILYVV
jgi:hypothetical protein